MQVSRGAEVILLFPWYSLQMLERQFFWDRGSMSGWKVWVFYLLFIFMKISSLSDVILPKQVVILWIAHRAIITLLETSKRGVVFHLLPSYNARSQRSDLEHLACVGRSHKSKTPYPRASLRGQNTIKTRIKGKGYMRLINISPPSFISCKEPVIWHRTSCSCRRVS